MAFVSDQFDQLRDLLDDTGDTQVSFATKKLYLNRGIARLWPRVWRIASTTITIATETYDYALPVAVADGHIVAVELSREAGGSEYDRFDSYDIIPGDEDTAGVFRFVPNPEAYIDYTVRIRYVQPCSLITAASYAAAQSETWVGPDRAIGLPVLYAASLIAARRLDNRQDHTRYSTTQAQNGVTDTDIMQSSQYWMSQFELELEDMGRPLPIARD